MGFSVAGAGGVIFVALIVAASIMSGVVYNSMEDLQESAEDNVNDWIKKGQTTFSIQTILYNRTNDQLKITIRNTGATVLNASKVDLLKNGEMISDEKIDMDVVNKDGYHWPPDENLKITVDDADLEFFSSVSGRVNKKLRTGISNPESLSTNSKYTYIIDDGNIDIYDNFGTYKKEIINGVLDDPKDLSSSYSQLYVLDNYSHIDRFNRKGDNGVKLISNGGELDKPKAISVTDENADDHLYILDNNTHVDKYDLDGTFIETVIDNLQGAVDIYVTDYIYIVNSTSNSIERYDLDGTSPTTLISDGELTNPSNITVSDQDFTSPYIYVIDSKNHIDTFDMSGNFVTTIDNKMGSDLGGIDIAGRLHVSNGLNGVYILNVGTKIKVVLENAIADYKTT